MENRIELEIITIVPAHSHGAYTLVLGEKSGERKLPVLIGAFEAQSIAMELEGMVPTRPLTHDLMVNLMNELEIEVTEVLITNLKEGVFYSTIVCKSGDTTVELDSRTSDAIAIAVKMKSPIFVKGSIMEEAAYELDDLKEAEAPGRMTAEELVPISKSHQGWGGYSLPELESMLEEAIRDEDYSKAAQIRDEISKRK